MVRVSIGVQHHPARAALLTRLLPLLNWGGNVDIATDPDPDHRLKSAWRTYRVALEATPEWATHRLVIQDDTIPCRDFQRALHDAVAARPDRMIALCVCGEPVQAAYDIHDAAATGWSWCVLPRYHYVPAIAVVWPQRMIHAALSWVDEQNWPEGFTADDEIIGRYINHTGETVLATVPSLVHHDDLVDSVINRRAAYGLDPGRVTTCPVPDCCDPSTIDWTLGPL